MAAGAATRVCAGARDLVRLAHRRGAAGARAAHARPERRTAGGGCSRPAGAGSRGRRASILSTAMDWWVRICAGSRRSRCWGRIKSKATKIPRAAEDFAAAGRSTQRKGRGRAAASRGDDHEDQSSFHERRKSQSCWLWRCLSTRRSWAAARRAGLAGRFGGTFLGRLAAGGMRGAMTGGAGGQLDGRGRIDRTVDGNAQGAATHRYALRRARPKRRRARPAAPGAPRRTHGRRFGR